MVGAHKTASFSHQQTEVLFAEQNIKCISFDMNCNLHSMKKAVENFNFHYFK